jgi:hypothetical protein
MVSRLPAVNHDFKCVALLGFGRPGAYLSEAMHSPRKIRNTPSASIYARRISPVVAQPRNS